MGNLILNNKLFRHGLFSYAHFPPDWMLQKLIEKKCILQQTSVDLPVLIHPELNGIELIAELQGHLPPSGVLLITVNAHGAVLLRKRQQSTT